MDHSELMGEQLRLEAAMVDAGLDRYRRASRAAREADRWTDTPGYRHVLRYLIEPTEKAIADFLAGASTGRPGRGHSAHAYLTGLTTDVLAFITAKSAINLASTCSSSLTSLCTAIGAAVEMEARLLHFERTNENSAYLKTVLRDLGTRTANAGHKRAVVTGLIGKHGDTWEPWSSRIKVLVGSRLLDCFIAATQMVEIVQIKTAAKRKKLMVYPSQSLRDWALNVEIGLEIYQSDYWPTVVPPKRWDDLAGGGYYTGQPLPLIKRNKEASARTVNSPANLGEVFDAINAAQSTAWRVNLKVLGVIGDCLERGLTIGGLPVLENLPIPVKPTDIAENEQARRRWRRQAAEVHLENYRSFSSRSQLYRCVALARQVAHYPAIYFPYQLDFRGRMYTVPTTISPQGADWNRALLQFAKGKPLDSDRAIGWFLIHGANTFGEDKVALDARIGWVYDNVDNILASASDPLEHRWWCDADAPWAFLAWAIEFARWHRRPEDFVSHIPIAIDGSCNGLQHYSAMLRDPVGGAATNLTPSPRPSDIYAEVASVVMAKLAASDEPMAAQWHAFGIDRKVCKRPVMVLPYGGTRRSCTTYVTEAVRDRIDAGAPNPFGEELGSACIWLSGIVWDSIGEVVIAARAAMAWLQDCARIASHAGVDLEWRVPSGFGVHQLYRDTSSVRVKTRIQGVEYKLRLVEEAATIDKRRQANGVAPNFVHSLDAAALVGTINMAADNGVGSFAIIHDSFGTHASDMDVLSTCVREAFVDLYSDHAPLVEFREGLAARLPGVELPPLPEVGTLSLADVLESAYFFA